MSIIQTVFGSKPFPLSNSLDGTCHDPQLKLLGNQLEEGLDYMIYDPSGKAQFLPRALVI